MLHPDLLPFLSELKENNHKDWFDAHRDRYQSIRKTLVGFSERLIEGVSAFDESIAGLDPSRQIFRINRDIRFSKDKSPYKTNMGLYLAKGGKNAVYGGYYVHFDPEGCFMGGGCYQPQPPELKKLRAHIDLFGKELEDILADERFKEVYGELRGEQLRNMPKEYDKDHPQAHLLKFKSFFVSCPIDATHLGQEDFAGEIADTFEVMYPLLRFLNEGLD
ncbi:MAG: DUF2461 domain-containing protein [Bacteroidetes bacterium]|nr:MAG: DUF2461 domain-containing protein [Bacteroidota bacterium]